MKPTEMSPRDRMHVMEETPMQARMAMASEEDDLEAMETNESADKPEARQHTPSHERPSPTDRGH